MASRSRGASPARGLAAILLLPPGPTGGLAPLLLGRPRTRRKSHQTHQRDHGDSRQPPPHRAPPLLFRLAVEAEATPPVSWPLRCRDAWRGYVRRTCRAACRTPDGQGGEAWPAFTWYPRREPSARSRSRTSAPPALRTSPE